MKLWQQPAQLLPVRVRPVHGETLPSYLFRLAAANELDRPTLMVRAVGEPTANLTRFLIDRDYDLTLNASAVGRLETFTGIPVARLRKALPSLNFQPITPLPETIPMTRVRRCWNLHDHCDRCVARLPGQPTIRVHGLLFPRICKRHRRWVDTTAPQVDLTPAPEIVTAHRRYVRLYKTGKDYAWTSQQVFRAAGIVQQLAGRHDTNTALRTRWTARAAALRTGRPINTDSTLLFPEMVALAEVLCDLEWRRHVAIVDSDVHMDRFYRLVALRLGQPPHAAACFKQPAGSIHRNTNHLKRRPLEQWVAEHRYQFADIRTEFWRRHLLDHADQAPFPEIRHFK